MQENKIQAIKELFYREKLEILKYMYEIEHIEVEKNDRFDDLLSGLSAQENDDIFVYLLKEMDYEDQISVGIYLIKVYVKGFWYKIKRFITRGLK